MVLSRLPRNLSPQARGRRVAVLSRAATFLRSLTTLVHRGQIGLSHATQQSSLTWPRVYRGLFVCVWNGRDGILRDGHFLFGFSFCFDGR